MKLQELVLRNFGPVESATIRLRKINVMFGQNNSGKSMVARLVDTLSASTPPGKIMSGPYGYERLLNSRHRRIRLVHSGQNSEYIIYNLLSMVNDEIDELVTFKKRGCRIDVTTDRGTSSIKIRGSDALVSSSENKALIRHVRDLDRRQTLQRGNNRIGVYMPAVRNGTFETLDNIVLMRSRLLEGIVNTFEASIRTKENIGDLKRFIQSQGSFPTWMSDFIDLALVMRSASVSARLQDQFHRLFGAKLAYRTREGFRQLMFQDPSGFETNLTKAGSGVTSAFPILSGLKLTLDGGTFVVEEPEAHLEPSKQMMLVDLLLEEALSRHITLVITTHSDYIVKWIQAKVGQGIIRNDDLGIFFFNRPDGQLTKVKKIEIDKSGIPEEPLFQEAIESLITAVSKAA